MRFESNMSVVNLSEQQVKQLLDWPSVCDAVEQALRSVCEVRVGDEQPISKQPTRIFTSTERGILYFFVVTFCIWNRFNLRQRF